MSLSVSRGFAPGRLAARHCFPARVARTALLVAGAAMLLAATPGSSHAQYQRNYGGGGYHGGQWHGGNWHGGNWHGGGGYWRGPGYWPGAAVGAGVALGLGLGALAVAPYYAPPVYYAPPPVYYAPPPAYYPYPVPYGYIPPGG